ncbi:hypothetical protein Tco_1193448 [Tanacetum coccineum]
MKESSCVKPSRRFGIHSSSLTKAIHKSRIARLIFLLKNKRSSQSLTKKPSIAASSGSSLLANVTAIEEAKDLATLPLDELIGNLKVYEMQTTDDSDSQEGSDEDIDEEEAEAFNLLARNFSKFFRKGNQFGRGNQFSNGGNQFGKGHVIVEYLKHTPHLKTLKNSRPLPNFKEYVVSTSVYTPYIILWSNIKKSTLSVNTPYPRTPIHRTGGAQYAVPKKANTPYRRSSICRTQEVQYTVPKELNTPYLNQLKKILEYFILGAHAKSSDTPY